MQIPEIHETENEKSLSDKNLKIECFQYARKNFQGKLFRNANTGRDILVSRDGLDKWNNVTKSREQCISIKVLDKLLENSRIKSSDIDRKNRHTVHGFDYFESKIIINEKLYISLLITKITHGSDSKYYYHYLQEKK